VEDKGSTSPKVSKRKGSTIKPSTHNMFDTSIYLSKVRFILANDRDITGNSRKHPSNTFIEPTSPKRKEAYLQQRPKEELIIYHYRLKMEISSPTSL